MGRRKENLMKRHHLRRCSLRSLVRRIAPYASAVTRSRLASDAF